MDFVDENDSSAIFVAVGVNRSFHEDFDFGDFAMNGTAGTKGVSGVLSDESGNGCFAGTWGTPKNKGAIFVLFKHPAKPGAGCKELLLAHKVLNLCWPSFFCQRYLRRMTGSLKYRCLFHECLSGSGCKGVVMET